MQLHHPHRFDLFLSSSPLQLSIRLVLVRRAGGPESQLEAQ